MVSAILASRSSRELQEQVSPNTAKGILHALISWILAFSRSGEGYGFPFDLPYLTLYERIAEAHLVLDRVSTIWPEKTYGALAKLNRCKEILQTVMMSKTTDEFEKIVAELRRDLRIFERFRAALRICPKGGKQRRNDGGTTSALNAERHRAILKRLRASLLCQARQKKSNVRACRIVVEHLDKYWPFLFGHVVRKRPIPVIVPRTNNDEERLFRTIKRQCRRLHGRGHLSKDVDSMAAGTALVLNLRNDSYCDTVYGGTDPQNIADRFSEVDPWLPAKLLKTWRSERLSARIPRKFETVGNLPEQLIPFIVIASEKLSKST